MVAATSRASALLIAFWAFAAAANDACVAQYGDVVVFDQCNPIALPGVTIKLVGVSQPHKGIPLSCWNYEAYLPGAEKTAFQHCHTGALGGEANFRVADKSFTAIFDTSAGCARSPAGSWAPQSRGHSFFAGVLDSAAIEGVRRKQMQAEEACFKRN